MHGARLRRLYVVFFLHTCDEIVAGQKVADIFLSTSEFEMENFAETLVIFVACKVFFQDIIYRNSHLFPLELSR